MALVSRAPAVTPQAPPARRTESCGLTQLADGASSGDAVLTRAAGVGFGLRVAVVHDSVEAGAVGAVVTHVTKGGPADIAGINVGNRIVGINGLDVSQATHNDIASLLGVARLTLRLHTLPDTQLLPIFTAERAGALGRGGGAARQVSEERGVVTISRGSNGAFGLAFRDNPRSGAVHVSRVVPGGAAWHDGRVQEGMEVTDMNGVDLEGMSADALSKELLRTTPDSLTLGLATVGYRVLRLTGSGDIGLVLGGSSDADAVQRGVRGVFVAGAQPGSPAAAAVQAGELIVGHQVLQINAVATTSMSLQDIAATLTKLQPDEGDTVLKMSTAPNTELFEAYTELPSAVLNSGPRGYGLSIVGPASVAEAERRCAGVLVVTHEPLDGSAPIERGLQIVRVNDQDVFDLSVDHVRGLLQFHRESVTLGLRRNTRAYKEYIGDGPAPLSKVTHTDSTTVTIHRKAGSFGVQFNGAQSKANDAVHGLGLFIAGVKPGSPASCAEGLEIGWQLVRLNGLNMRDASFTELEMMLRRVGDTLTLHLEPNPELFKNYQQLTTATQANPKPMVRGGKMRSSIVGHPTAKSEPASALAPPLDTPQFTVKLSRPAGGGFGLMFGGPRDADEAQERGHGVFVSGVKGDSVAATVADIQIGLQIVSINGTDLIDATFVQLKEVLQQVGNDMTLVLRENLDLIRPYRKADYRGKPMRSSVKRKKETVTATLKKEPGEGFGLRFGGARSKAEADESGYGIFVSGTALESIAAKNPDLRVGWQIVTMNGEELLEATFVEMKKALQRLGDTMVLRLTQNESLRSVYTKKKQDALRSSVYRKSKSSSTPPPTQDEVAAGGPATPPQDGPLPLADGDIPAVLNKGPDGYGLSFGGPKNSEEADALGYGIFISKVKPNSVAEKCRDLKVGWQVVSINGTSLEAATFAAMKTTLSSVGDTMRLVLRNNEVLRTAYAEKKQKSSSADDDKKPDSPVNEPLHQVGSEEVAPAPAAQEALHDDEEDPDFLKDADEEDGDTALETVTATLEKDGKGFGLKFGGPKTVEDADAHDGMRGIFISGVKPDTVAERSQDVKVGWQIIKLNEHDITSATFVDMKQVLATVTVSMKLTLRANEALRSSYAKKKSKANGEGDAG